MDEGHSDQSLLEIRNAVDLIRGECHAVVRAITRPEELFRRLRAIDVSLDEVVRAADRLSGVVPTRTVRDDASDFVDLVSLARQSVSRYQAFAASAGVSLRLSAHGASIGLYGDPFQLRRMFDGLLGRAIRQASPGGVVYVAVTGRREALHVRIGWDAHDAPLPPSDGGAVALRMVRSCVSSHHGSLVLEDGGCGSTVRVELPVRMVA